MADLWRLTRNPHARRVYDALKRVGITATRMYEYRATVEEAAVSRSPAPPAGVRIETLPAAEAANRGLDIDFSLPVDPFDGEWAIVAFADGVPVGRTLVGATPSPYVDPLERSVAVRGAYVRRVFVVPTHRGAGVASAALRAALAVAREELDTTTATALIAADNRPSQRLFEGRGFERVGAYEYARVGPLSTYRTRSV